MRIGGNGHPLESPVISTGDSSGDLEEPSVSLRDRKAIRSRSPARRNARAWSFRCRWSPGYGCGRSSCPDCRRPRGGVVSWTHLRRLVTRGSPRWLRLGAGTESVSAQRLLSRFLPRPASTSFGSIQASFLARSGLRSGMPEGGLGALGAIRSAESGSPPSDSGWMCSRSSRGGFGDDGASTIWASGGSTAEPSAWFATLLAVSGLKFSDGHANEADASHSSLDGAACQQSTSTSVCDWPTAGWKRRPPKPPGRSTWRRWPTTPCPRSAASSPPSTRRG